MYCRCVRIHFQWLFFCEHVSICSIGVCLNYFLVMAYYPPDSLLLIDCLFGYLVKWLSIILVILAHYVLKIHIILFFQPLSVQNTHAFRLSHTISHPKTRFAWFVFLFTVIYKKSGMIKHWNVHCSL